MGSDKEIRVVLNSENLEIIFYTKFGYSMANCLILYSRIKISDDSETLFTNKNVTWFAIFVRRHLRIIHYKKNNKISNLRQSLVTPLFPSTCPPSSVPKMSDIEKITSFSGALSQDSLMK